MQQVRKWDIDITGLTGQKKRSRFRDAIFLRPHGYQSSVNPVSSQHTSLPCALDAPWVPAVVLSEAGGAGECVSGSQEADVLWHWTWPIDGLLSVWKSECVTLGKTSLLYATVSSLCMMQVWSWVISKPLPISKVLRYSLYFLIKQKLSGSCHRSHHVLPRPLSHVSQHRPCGDLS